MDLFELSATLGLDTSGFSFGIAGAMNMITGLTDFAQEKFSWLAETVFDFGKDVLGTGLEFDRNLTAVYALTDATDEYSKNLFKQTAITEAMASTFTTAEVAAAGTYEALAGWDLEESAAALHGIIVTAEAAGEDLKPISDIITDTTSAFHESSDRALHYGDVFASAATNANTNIGQIGEALKMVGPIAGGVGYNIEDITVWLQLMGDSAIKSGQAGRSLRNFIARIGTDAGATSNTLGALGIVTEKLGVQFYDSENNARPLLDVTNELRDSWQGLDDDTRNNLLESLGDADTAYQTLQSDIATVNELKAKSEAKDVSASDYESYIAQAKEIIDSYTPLFEALNIDVEKTSMWNLLDILGTKFEGLNDKQQLEYGKQMSSLQGMAALIAVMNASADDYNDAVNAAYNAEGAADKMREERLNSLAGDVDKFNSTLDGMKTLMYEDIRDPLRSVVQEGKKGLDRINDAIGERGIIGGLKQLTEELRNLKENETFKEFLKSAGEAGGEILSIITTDVLPALDDTVVGWGHKLAEGAMGGISDYLAEHGKVGSGIFGLLANWFGTDMSNGTGSMTGTNNVFEVPAEVVITSDVQRIQGLIDEAVSKGKTTVTVDGIEFSTDYPAEAIADALGYAGEQGGKQMMDNVADKVSQNAPGIGGILSLFVGDAGDTAGSTFSTLFGNILGGAAPRMSDDLGKDIGKAGTIAGNDVVSDIQSALSFATFSVSVIGVVSQIVNTVKNGFNHNASAMSSGRIYNRPTVFGYYDNAYQVAGDAGPEAVVGVNSLQRMITNAVHSASAGSEVFAPREAQSRPVTVIMQVGEKEFGRLAFELGSAEEQRVGVRLAKGGAY